MVQIDNKASSLIMWLARIHSLHLALTTSHWARCSVKCEQCFLALLLMQSNLGSLCDDFFEVDCFTSFLLDPPFLGRIWLKGDLSYDSCEKVTGAKRIKESGL